MEKKYTPPPPKIKKKKNTTPPKKNHNRRNTHTPQKKETMEFPVAKKLCRLEPPASSSLERLMSPSSLADKLKPSLGEPVNGEATGDLNRTSDGHKDVIVHNHQWCTEYFVKHQWWGKCGIY